VIDNSSAGLVMLESEVTVTVTREDRHQAVLARYPVAAGMHRPVAVELGWCAIGSGKYRGQPAIEVRLDGYRVGELTYAMSQRYAPLVSQVTSRGGRPGCEAAIQRATKGLEIVLRLPRHADGVVPIGPALRPVPTAPGSWSGPSSAPAPTPPPQWSSPVPPAPRRVASHRPWWIAAAVVAVLFVGALASNDDEPSTSNTASDLATSTTAPATTTTPRATTAAPTTTTAAPITTTAEAPAPPPPAQQAVPKPVPVPAKPAPAPKPPPQPQPQCDPNYSGCVPIASDVDCAGGSGNGPAYVAGPIRVIGSDIYGLDNDNDGVACE